MTVYYRKTGEGSSRPTLEDLRQGRVDKPAAAEEASAVSRLICLEVYGWGNCIGAQYSASIFTSHILFSSVFRYSHCFSLSIFGQVYWQAQVLALPILDGIHCALNRVYCL